MNQKIDIYLAGPYSHKDSVVRSMRYVTLTRAAGLIACQGLVVFSPITHSHQMAVYCDMSTDWAFWKLQDERFIACCEEVWCLMMPGFMDSVGLAAEKTFAQEQDIPWIFVEPEHVSRAIDEWKERHHVEAEEAEADVCSSR